MLQHVHSDAEFNTLFNNTNGLFVVDYFATWCGPCQQIAPFFEQLSNKYQSATFAKVDVDKCPSTAASQGVSAMPTFIFYVKKAKVDSLRGANPTELEAKVKKWSEAAGSSGLNDETQCEVPGQMDLTGFISKNECECLNFSGNHNFKRFMDSNNSENCYLESDCDEQLIINLSFNQPVKIHSIKVKGPEKYAPKTVKIFINTPVTMDFDQALRSNAVQVLELNEKQVLDGEIINLFFVKFQNVRNITLFIVDNQGCADTTRLTRLQFYGTPLSGTTNMQEFKRVAGKAGEAH
uniref:Thioredoxin-like protein 1 n=1 Tax=Romanomermis culicivorax TaxID=13658 RepID=A0A915JL08_ROMCU